MDRQILQMGPYSFFLSPVAFHILRNLSFMEYLLFRFSLVAALLQQTEMTHRHWNSLRLIKDQGLGFNPTSTLFTELNLRKLIVAISL